MSNSPQEGWAIAPIAQGAQRACLVETNTRLPQETCVPEWDADVRKAATRLHIPDDRVVQRDPKKSQEQA